MVPFRITSISIDELRSIKMLLDMGAAIKILRGVYGTALRAAFSVEGHIELAKLLLDAGADANVAGSPMTRH